METVGLQERLREPEMVATGASNAELKITPELGPHMMVCSNRWLNEAVYGFRPVRDGSLFCFMEGYTIFFTYQNRNLS